MKTKTYIKRGVEYTIKTNDKSIKLDKLGDDSSIISRPEKPKPEKTPDIIALENLNIKNIKPSEVDLWVENNINSIEDIKIIIKDIIKLNCNRPYFHSSKNNIKNKKVYK